MFFKNFKLNTRIVFLFLVISLLPLIIFGILLLQNFSSAVSTDRINDLTGRLQLKQDALNTWVNDKHQEIRNLSKISATSDAILTLSEIYEDYGFNSPQFNSEIEKIDLFYKDYVTNYNFDDVLLIDDGGNIVYSAIKETDFKVNLFEDNHSQTILTDAYKTSIRGETFMSDYSNYNTISGKYVIFLSTPVESQGNIIGVVVIRLKTDQISEIMVNRSGMGETGESFIVGDDYFIRTDSRFKLDGESDILKTKIETDNIKQALAGLTVSGIETDYRGNSVLLVAKKMNVKGLTWVVEVKIDESEALSTVYQAQKLLYIVLVSFSVIIFILAWFFGRTISRPIKDMSDMAKQIALGHLDFKIKIDGKDEISELWQSIHGIVESQKQVSKAAVEIAQGNVDIVLHERSNADTMSQAMNQMVGVIKETITRANTIAKGDFTSNILPRSENDQLNIALKTMNAMLLENKLFVEKQNWLQDGVIRINNLLLGEENPEVLAEKVLTEVSKKLETKIGAFYIVSEDDKGPLLELQATYAFVKRKNLSNTYRLGEGLIGQAAKERKQILIQNIPDDYITVVSGLGESLPKHICVTPFFFNNNLLGVLEFGTLMPLGEKELMYLEQIASAVAISFEMAKNQNELKKSSEGLKLLNEELFEQTKALEQSKEELENQQAELETINTELNSQMQRVQESEAKLKEQQEALEISNSELLSKNELLENQKKEIEIARQNIAKQAEEVALANKHKTNFLANMSHELRTPLNSLLLLSRSLKENKNGNLDHDEIESVSVIYDSGSDLLNLINEILDLSKIEAGRMDVNISEIRIEEIEKQIKSQFSHIAENQNLELLVKKTEKLPDFIRTDFQLLSQVLKNLLSNAFKFTEKGSVSIIFDVADEKFRSTKNGLLRNDVLTITVADTGIGIPTDKIAVIFEAFKQLDTGDQKRYKGTGLGLTITKDFVELIGGEIQVKSEIGIGSEFTVFIPFNLVVAEEGDNQSSNERYNLKSSAINQSELVMHIPEKLNSIKTIEIPDDRDNISENDRVILLIEDDVRFLKILGQHVKKGGFKLLNAITGEEGLELAMEYKPNGVILDLQLPGIDGWTVLNILKQEVTLRHIPVHIVSGEEAHIEALNKGAIGLYAKPITQEQISTVLERIEAASAKSPKRVLVVEDDDLLRKETVRIVGNGNVTVDDVATGKDALKALKKNTYNLAIIDLGLPDMQGVELLKQATEKQIKLPSIIIHTVRELTVDEELSLRNYAESIIIKDVRSQERLIDEVALFLHRVVSDLPEENRRAILHLRESDEPLRGKKVLIAEDDMRTMFAMARLLAGHGMNPIKAENGLRAVEMLQENPDVEIVLMDIMMPVMDGYEAMRKIRSIDAFAFVPIIALTAKAMKEDRQKCLDAGATDYLTKPVNPDRLTSLMRVLLCK